MFGHFQCLCLVIFMKSSKFDIIIRCSVVSRRGPCVMQSTNHPRLAFVAGASPRDPAETETWRTGCDALGTRGTRALARAASLFENNLDIYRMSENNQSFGYIQPLIETPNSNSYNLLLGNQLFLRGQILGLTVRIERKINDYLSSYFCDTFKKKNQINELLFFTEKISLDMKRQMFVSLLKATNLFTLSNTLSS